MNGSVTVGSRGASATAAGDGLDLRIVAGGAIDAVTEAAIVAAVTQVLGERDGGSTVAPAAWALAGRIEASDGRSIRSRALLPGTSWSA